jgi:DNA-binding transcriptional LysR family regulator
VSHALQRLRKVHGDPLFIRTQGGMAPTAKAQHLAKAVEQALAVLDVALRETQTYDPARRERTFRLHLTDIGETIFLPPLIESLSHDAPRVRLAAYQLDDRDILPALESGRIDLALGYIPALTGVQRQYLLSEQYVVVLRAGHPVARRSRCCATRSCARTRPPSARWPTSGSPTASRSSCRISWCCRGSWPNPISPR